MRQERNAAKVTVQFDELLKSFTSINHNCTNACLKYFNKHCSLKDATTHLPALHTLVFKKQKKAVSERALCWTGQKGPLLFSQRTNQPHCSWGSVHTDDSMSVTRTRTRTHVYLRLPTDYNTCAHTCANTCALTSDPSDLRSIPVWLRRTALSTCLTTHKAHTRSHKKHNRRKRRAVNVHGFVPLAK